MKVLTDMEDLTESKGRLHAEFLAKVATIVAASLDRDTVLRRCLEELNQIVAYETGTVAIFSKGIEWELAVGLGFKDELLTKMVSATVLKESPILKQMAEDLQPVVSSDVHHLSGWMWISGAEHVRSFMAVPMISSDRMIGVLMLDKSEVGYFGDEDLALVQTLARTLAVAVEKAQLYEDMEQRLAEKDALLAVSKAVSSSLELEVVLSKLVEQMARAIDMTSAYISDFDEEQDTKTVRVEYISPEASEKEKISDVGITYKIAEVFGEDWTKFTVGDMLIEHVDDPGLTAKSRDHYLRYGAKSVIILPLMIKGQIVGFADLWESRRHRDFTASEIALSQAIAQHAAVAIENAQLFAEKKEQLQLATTLQAVGALLTTRLSLPELFDQIFDLLAQIVTYDSSSVQLVGEDGSVSIVAGTGFAKLEPYKEFARLHGEELIERFSKGKKVRFFTDTNEARDWIQAPGLTFTRSWIGAALMVKGRLIGVLNVDNTQPNSYNSKTAETVLTFANQAAIAIENARLYEETNQRANEMMALHQVALATSVLPDIDSLLQKTTRLLSESLYPEHFGFLLVGKESNELYPHPSFHGAPKELLNKPIPIDESICGIVYKTGQPTIIGDISAHEKYYHVTSTTASEIVVPLTVRGKVIGVINVESSQLNAFSNNDLRFLTTLAGQVATFIERSDLYQAQRRYTAHLAKEVSERTVALRSERDRMQAILDNAGEGIFFTDENGIILYVNTTMIKVTGFSANELLHLSPAQWPGISHSPGLLESLQRAIQEAKPWKREMAGKRKDSRDYDIYLTVTPIFNREGTLSGLVGVHSDISYLKEVERLKARFISNVSHELRTPLTVIETYTTLLKQGRADRHEHYLDVLSVETKRLTRLIQDVLDLSRLEAEKAPILMETLQIDFLISQVANTFSPHAEIKNIDLQVELESGLLPVWGNGMQIEQVITNLVNNALIYTPDCGIVLIKAGMGKRDDLEMIWFSVADTGYGVPAEDIPLIFDRFFRAKAMESAGIRGTGLGLAICKEIVDRHQGYIEVESELGQGSVFTVWLPIEELKETG